MTIWIARTQWRINKTWSCCQNIDCGRLSPFHVEQFLYKVTCVNKHVEMYTTDDSKGGLDPDGRGNMPYPFLLQIFLILSFPLLTALFLNSYICRFCCFSAPCSAKFAYAIMEKCNPTTQGYFLLFKVYNDYYQI